MNPNNFMNFDTLDKHCPLDSKCIYIYIYTHVHIYIYIYNAYIHIYIYICCHGYQFETRIWKQISRFLGKWSILMTQFSIDINVLPANFQTEVIELQSERQLKDKFDLVFLLEFHRSHLPTDRRPSLHYYALSVSSLFGRTYICEQLFSRMIHTESEVRTKTSDGHFENSWRITAPSSHMWGFGLSNIMPKCC